MGYDEDLGIRSDVPFRERVEYAVGMILGILSLEAFNYVYAVLLLLIIASGLFAYTGKWWLNVLLFIGLFAVVAIWGAIKLKFVDPWLSTLFFGKPVFGRLGGEPRSTFFTGLKAADAIEIELEEEDLEMMRDYTRLRAELVEEQLKLAYRTEVYEPQYGPADDADFQARWTAVWEEQILTLQTENLTFRDALAETNLNYVTGVGHTYLIAQVMDRLTLIFQLAMLFLTTLLLKDRLQFLLVVQIGVFLSFIFSIVWYLAHSIQTGVIHLLVDFDQIPEALRPKFAEKYEPFVDKQVRPKKVVIKKRWYALMRGYELRSILSSFTYALGGLVLVGASLLIGRLWNSADLDSWYKTMALALIIIPFFFTLGFYLISVILQYSKQVLAPVIAGLVGVVLPYAIEYVVTGEFELYEVENAVSSVIAGLGILLATTVATHLKRSLEGES